MSDNKQEIKLNVDTTELKEAIQITRELVSTIKRANSLADELASKKLTIEIDI